jgi:hypothetical protein
MDRGARDVGLIGLDADAVTREELRPGRAELLNDPIVRVATRMALLIFYYLTL